MKTPKLKLPPKTIETEEGFIPSKLGIIEDPSDSEAEPFVLSFVYYKDKHCEIDNLIKNAGRKTLKDLRIIGRLTNIEQFRKNNIDRKFIIKNSTEYRKLYYGLPPDVELFENVIQGTARLFYFTIANTFYIVVITNKHLETKKTRR